MQLVHGKTHLKKFASRTVLSILHLSIGTVQFRALILSKMMCRANAAIEYGSLKDTDAYWDY